MITNEQARILAVASEASYGETPVPVGYERYQAALPLNNTDTGFNAEIYRKTGTNEYIIAFTGTQRETSQDPVADISLGKKQWEYSRANVLTALSGLDGPPTNISFTGHSLGGALAQYAAYDYLERTNSPAQVSLTTYNGLGGMAGLQQMYGSDFNPGIASQIDSAHFFASSSGKNDLVARLGEGHLGGNTYQIDMSQTNAGIGAIHSAWEDFKNLEMPQTTSDPGYLNIPGAQKLAELFTLIGNDGKITNVEGWSRLAGGVILALNTASSAEIDQIGDALLPELAYVDWGLARDLLPPQIRLPVTLLGVELVVLGNEIQLLDRTVDWTTDHIEATIGALEDAVKISQHALDQAIETGSAAIDSMRDMYAQVLDYAADRALDLVDEFDHAVDYTLAKLQKMQELGAQVNIWLKDQLAYVGQVADETISLGPWAIKLLWSDNKLSQNISDKISSLFSTAQSVAQARRDPLTLDLDNDGLETVGINTASPILFDHDADGVKTATGWIKPDDGFLVLDRNGNGTIDNGRELFGDSTPLLAGGNAADGFAALAQEDTNADGVVDANDARFASLRVWRDLNSDGISQANELQTLGQAGIAAIHVAKTENAQVLPNGNQLADLGTFIRTDGSTGGLGEVTAQMADIDLAEDTFHSSFSDTIPVSDEIAQLPAMNGSGRVRSLHEAASLSPTLADLLTQFTAANTRAGQTALLDQIITEWGKTSDMPVSGAGAYNGLPTTIDIAGLGVGGAEYNAWVARLQTLERFNGRPYAVPADGATSITIAFFVERKELIDQAYEVLSESVYSSLLMQTRLKPYLDEITLDVTETGISLNFSGMLTKLELMKEANTYNATVDLTELIMYAQELLAGSNAQLESKLQEWAADPDTAAMVNNALQSMDVQRSGYVSGSAVRDLLFGKETADSFFGNAGNDLLMGGGGNDQLYGGNGDDILDGGTGNDIMYGETGNDTYRFGRGSGTDYIGNYAADHATAVDTVEFGVGISQSDLELRKENNSLRIVIRNSGDSLLISNWFLDDTGKVDQFRFADGSMLTAAELEAKGSKVYGGTGNDVLNGSNSDDQMYGYEGSDTLNGKGGNDLLDGGAGYDFLSGNDGNDTLLGGADTDQLYGGNGDDILDGGTGNDTLQGETGNDTYRFGRGSGTDTIGNYAADYATAVDTVEFGANISSSDLDLYRDGNNLRIAIRNSSDVLVISSWFYDDTGKVDQFRFADGSMLTAAQLEARGVRINGTTGNDTLNGSNANDLLYGYEGSDTLNGKGGNDLLDGGAGYDFLSGNDGNDTLLGGADTDQLYGGNGDDILDGGTGNDTLQGETGNDTYRFGRGSGTDTIGNYAADYATAVDTVEFGANISSSDLDLYRDGNNLRIAIRNSSDALVISSWFYDDTGKVDQFRFADGTMLTAAQLEARGVRVNGTTGNDVLNGSNSGDQIYGYDGSDNLYGKGGNDSIDGGNGNDNVWGDDGNDTLLGGADTDQIYGGNGDDILDGGSGNDRMYGGSGNDTYVVDSTGDVISEAANEGTDTVISSISYSIADKPYLENITLSGTANLSAVGNVSNNLIIGNAAINALSGGAGNDTLDGGAGNDTLDGGSGNDSLIGSSGDDTYLYSLGGGHDRITDLSGTDRILFGTGISAAQTGVSRQNGDIVLTVSATESIRFSDSAAEPFAVERIEFANGTVWQQTELRQMLNAIPAGQLLVGGTAAQNQTLTASAMLSDADGIGSISYQWQFSSDNGASWHDIDKATDQGFTLTNEQVGGQMRVSASYIDGHGTLETVTSTATEAITNINDAPELALPLSGQTATEDQPFSFTIPAGTFHDIDAGDSLTLSATMSDGSALPEWLSFDAVTATFSGIPGNGQVGELQLNVTATDISGTQTSSNFNITVTNANDAPELLVSLFGQTATEDQPFSFTVPAGTFNDIDAGDSLTLSATLFDGSALPEWLTFDAVTATFSGTPGNGQVGELQLSVTATDLSGATVSSGFNLNIANVNDAPELLVPLFGQTATEDQPFSFTIPTGTFQDIDAGDSLTLSATQADGSYLPSWLTFDPVTGTFSGTPGNGQAGALELSVTATDQSGAAASGSFMLSISENSSGNSAPTATPDVASISEGTCPPFVTGNLLANDTDPDGDTLTVTTPGFRQGEYGYIGIAADGRYGYMLNNLSRDVQSLGRDTQVTERFDYQVSDGTEQSASSLEITINGKNDAPVVARHLADQQIKNNKAFSFVVPTDSFKDVDQGDTLTYSATLANGKSLPSWLKFNADTGTFSGTAPKNTGAIDIRVTATDKVAATGNTEGSLSVSDTFQLSFGKGNSSKPHCDDDYDQHDQQHQNRPQHHSKNRDDDLDDRYDHHRHDRDDRHGGHHTPLPKLPDGEQLDRYLNDLDEASSHSSHDGHAMAERWRYVSRVLARDLAELGSEYGKSHKLGAETGGFHRDLAGTLGSTHAFGMNTLLAAGSSGTDLKGFKGLHEGVKHI